MPPTPVILREAEGEVAESTSLNEPSPSGREGGPSKTVGEGRGRTLSQTPHLPCRTPSPQGEGFSLLFEMWILQLRASPACRMTCEEKEKFMKVSSIPF